MLQRTVLIVSLLALVGCGAAARGLGPGINRSALSSEKSAQHGRLVAEGDTHWQQRADRGELEAAIASWEAAVSIKDSDWETYTKLARATYLLADGWLSFEAGTAAGNAAFLAMHERGYAFAERGMAALSRDFEKRLKVGTKIEDAVRVLDRNGVPLVYWYATNLGKWAKAKDFATLLEYKDRIFGMVSLVYETAPTYFHGAADRYFGAYYAVAPPFAGGDDAKSAEHFRASLKEAPNYLGTYVLIAELLDPKMGPNKDADPEAFDRNLRTVIDATTCPSDGTSSAPCILEGLEAEAAVEKRKAHDLIKRKDDLF